MSFSVAKLRAMSIKNQLMVVGLGKSYKSSKNDIFAKIIFTPLAVLYSSQWILIGVVIGVIAMIISILTMMVDPVLKLISGKSVYENPIALSLSGADYNGLKDTTVIEETKPKNFPGWVKESRAFFETFEKSTREANARLGKGFKWSFSIYECEIYAEASREITDALTNFSSLFNKEDLPEIINISKAFVSTGMLGSAMPSVSYLPRKNQILNVASVIPLIGGRTEQSYFPENQDFVGLEKVLEDKLITCIYPLGFLDDTETNRIISGLEANIKSSANKGILLQFQTKIQEIRNRRNEAWQEALKYHVGITKRRFAAFVDSLPESVRASAVYVGEAHKETGTGKYPFTFPCGWLYYRPDHKFVMVPLKEFKPLGMKIRVPTGNTRPASDEDWLQHLRSIHYKFTDRLPKEIADNIRGYD